MNYSHNTLHVYGSKYALDKHQRRIVTDLLRSLYDDPRYWGRCADNFQAARMGPEYFVIHFETPEGWGSSIWPESSHILDNFSVPSFAEEQTFSSQLMRNLGLPQTRVLTSSASRFAFLPARIGYLAEPFRAVIPVLWYSSDETVQKMTDGQFGFLALAGREVANILMVGRDRDLHTTDFAACETWAPKGMYYGKDYWALEKAPALWMNDPSWTSLVNAELPILDAEIIGTGLPTVTSLCELEQFVPFDLAGEGWKTVPADTLPDDRLMMILTWKDEGDHYCKTYLKLVTENGPEIGLHYRPAVSASDIADAARHLASMLTAPVLTAQNDFIEWLDVSKEMEAAAKAAQTTCE